MKRILWITLFITILGVRGKPNRALDARESYSPEPEMVSDVTPQAMNNRGLIKVSSEASPSVCAATVLPYSSLRQAKRSSYMLNIESSASGALHYFGVNHTSDPFHPQFEWLEHHFNAIRPTVIFYEGPERSLPLTRNSAIQEAGDSGFVRFVAAQNNVPALPLEPSRQAEIDVLLQRFPPEQIKLFYALRQAVELREVWHYSSKDKLRQGIIQALNRLSMFDGLTTVVTDIAEFEALYQQYWPHNDWWNAPQEWFNPVFTTAETGGRFTNDIHRTASTFRNQHMVQVLSEAVHQGHQVMAVAGKGHLPLQAPALKCLITG